MPLNPKDENTLATYQAERVELLERLATVDRIIAAVTGAVKPAGSGSHRSSTPQPVRPVRSDGQPLPANTTLGAAGEFMGQTLRFAVRQVLKQAEEPLEAPTIARRIYATGYQDDFKKLKTNVDTTLDRMRKDGSAVRTDRGYVLPSQTQAQPRLLPESPQHDRAAA